MMDERIHGLMKGRAYCAKKEIPEKKGTYCIFVISGLVIFRILEQMTYIRRIVIGVPFPPLFALLPR